MRRAEMEHAIRAACQIIDASQIIIVGSQSILGTYAEDELPERATMSREIDMLPIADGDAETTRLADVIEGVAGEFSPFEQLHGFSIDGVDHTTSVLPEGWRARLVEVRNDNTAGPGGHPIFVGWCLDKVDLCVAKLCAFREKDLEFVGALLDAGLVDAALVFERLRDVPPAAAESAARAMEWLLGPTAP